ncbi:folylpolyglutamate synthase, partial [Kickxella alabastrina]
MTVPENLGKIKLGLERISNFLESILPRDPRVNLKVVHVAGTNGKGSVCALISEALIAGSYKVGTFNSPHFLATNDAVRIQGVPIPASEYAELRAYINDLDAKAQSPNGRLSLFEQATAAALWWFSENNIDLAVIEVGMGGLRDATNVFGMPDGSISLGVGKSLVQCICPIDSDHLGMIGNTVEEIAHEKSGIMRPGSWIVVANQDRIEAFHKVRHLAHKISPDRVVNVRRQPTYDSHVSKFSIKHVAGEESLDAQKLLAEVDAPGWASFNGTGRRCLSAKYPPTLEIYKTTQSTKGSRDLQSPQSPQLGQASTGGNAGSSPMGVPASTELHLPLMLPGHYQAGNASVAFYALDVLRTHYGFNRLTDAAIQIGFQNVRWPGRLSWLRFNGDDSSDAGNSSPTSSNSAGSRGSTRSGSISASELANFNKSGALGGWILADGAHNEPAAFELRKYVETTLKRIKQTRYINGTSVRSFKDIPNVRWIVGFTRGKDMTAILNRIARAGDTVWAVPFSQPDEMPWIECTDTESILEAAKGT